jgi:hypothetical protein
VAEAPQNADEAMDKILSPLNEKELEEKMVDDLQKSNMGLLKAADDELRVVYDDLHEAEEETDVHHEADDDVQEADGDHLESADDEQAHPNSDVDARAADELVQGEDKLLEFEIMFGLVQAKDEPLVEDEHHGQEAVISYENYDYGDLAGQTGKCSWLLN